MLSQDDIKKLTGHAAVDLVENDMVLGVGTGTTAHWFIIALAEKVKAGLHCSAVPTSRLTEELARRQGIPLTTLNLVEKIHLTVDGADEIAPGLRLIKGGGGALLQEKMVAAASDRLVIIADHTKLVDTLGRFPLPVEVIPFGWKQVQRHIRDRYGIEAALRTHGEQPFTTDHGHYILDCPFGRIDDAPALNTALHDIPGVVETGLFTGLASQALVGYPDGSIRSIKSTGP